MGINKKLLVEHSTFGSIGLGALIVFIAVVLIAGIAASVLIQTSSTLEIQASTTGRETTSEVSTGLEICNIEGYAASGSDISKLIIMIRPRAGSKDINLNHAYIELSDTNSKIVFNYSSTCMVEDGSGQDNVFGADFFPGVSGQFGLLVLEDADDSCLSATPVINKGDKVLLGIDTSVCFNSNAGVDARTDVWGSVIPEMGSPGVIGFTTPASYTDNVIDLQ